MAGDPNRRVTVCAKCLQASCWHGEFMCDSARQAGLTERTVAELKALDREHRSHYSIANIRKITGDDNYGR